MTRIPRHVSEAISRQTQALDEPTRARIQRAVAILNQEPSGPVDQQGAWNDLVSVLPQVGVPVLARELSDLRKKGARDPFLSRLLSEHIAIFMDSVRDAWYPFGVEFAVQGLIDYYQLGRGPRNREALTLANASLQGAGICFSSLDFEYPRKEGPFISLSYLPSSAAFKLGWDYLPLIRAGVEADNCMDPPEATQVLEDLYRIGGPRSDEIMDLVAEDYFDESIDFVRAYLKLFILYPVDRRDEPPNGSRRAAFQRALTLLLPKTRESLVQEDRELFERALGHAAGYIRKADRIKLIEEVIAERPHYEGEIRELSKIALMLP